MFKTMQPYDLPPDDAEPFMMDDAWVAEPKRDGVRCVAIIEDGRVRMQSRSGLALPGRRVGSAVAALTDAGAWGPKAWVLDGECLPDGTLWLFDMPVMNGAEMFGSTLAFRRRQLTRIIGAADLDGVDVVDQATRADEKRALWDRVVADGAEGIVVKRLDSPYQQKKSRHWYKVKLSHTVDVLITAVEVEGKNNAAYSMRRDGEMCPIGHVSRRFPSVQPGMIVELQYRAADEALIEPRMIRVRTDKTVNDVTDWSEVRRRVR